LKLGVLSSGDLGNDTLEKIISTYSVSFVMTDHNSTKIINMCKRNKIAYFIGNPRNGNGYNFIINHNIDVLISINYLFIIEPDIINHPRILSFNIHGSLLPKYRGRTPHVWAIINNENKTGITAHKIDEGCDTGDIISKVKIPINENETGYDILKKYKLNYFNIVRDVLKKIELDKLEFEKQDENLATYFGKRTPDDGRINWNWHKERIHNWVRALSDPYPGAFSFYGEKKIIIDKVAEVSLGFRFNEENGTILKINPNIIVKTPNGALELKRIRNLVSVKIGGRLI
tara:strand:+ start:2931 stop:3791 length:861 start_codon:yes stop_codon:yes gene_type:complete